MQHIWQNTPAHMTKARCRAGITLLWGETDATKLARAHLAAMRKSFYDTGLFGLLESENAGSALFFDVHVPRIRYP